MRLNRTTSCIGKIGLLLPLLLIFFLAYDSAAQCYCRTSHSSVRKRTVKRVTYARRAPVYRVPASYTPPREYIDTENASYRITSRAYRVPVEDNGEIVYDVDYRETRRIARDYGYRDGWEDGEDAGMERDAYHPQNSGDYQKATNGYEDTFGDKDLYKEAYRSAYLSGYKAGFRSVASRSTIRAVKNW